MTTNTNTGTGTQGSTSNRSGARTGPLLIARSLGSFERPGKDHPSELIRDRFLCRGGSLLLCGSTGLGKSSLAIQLPAQFALGRAAFAIQPVRPLKSLIIQAENDDGDIAEFRDGAYSGYGYNIDEINTIQESVLIHTEVIRRGFDFCQHVLEPLCDHHRPDLIWVDHALAYYKGDASAQVSVGTFLREHVQPILLKFQAAVVILHHTPKPSENKRLTWTDRDFSYMGTGSIEWPNWARAVFVVNEVSRTVFELRAPKRGERLGWKDKDGNKINKTYIAWTNDKIFWRTPDPSEIPTTGKKPKTPPAPGIDPQDLKTFVIHAHPNGITWKAWWKAAADAFGGTEKSLRVGRDILRKEGDVYYDTSAQIWRLHA